MSWAFYDTLGAVRYRYINHTMFGPTSPHSDQSGAAPSTTGTVMYWDNINGEWALGDHGLLAGLSDDDHPQYRLESADHSHASSGLQGGNIAATSVTVADAGGYLAASEVEAALQEMAPYIGGRLKGISSTRTDTGNITSGTANWTDNSNVSAIYWTGASAASIYGFASGTDGKVLAFFNQGSVPVTFYSNNATEGTTTARLDMYETPFELQPDEAILFMYTAAGTSRWRPLVGRGGVPTGTIAMWPTATPPTGWLLCDGSSFTATTYPALNTLLGGTTLPDFRQRFPLGKAAAGTGSTLLGTGGTVDHTHDTHTSAVNTTAGGAATRLTGPTGTHSAVNPPFLSINFIIKT